MLTFFGINGVWIKMYAVKWVMHGFSSRVQIVSLIGDADNVTGLEKMVIRQKMITK